MLAADLDDLYRHHTNLGSRGPYFPRDVESEPAFRRLFDEGGFWEKESGALLIVEPDGTVVGDIGFFRCRPGGQWMSYEPSGPRLRHRGATARHELSLRDPADPATSAAHRPR